MNKNLTELIQDALRYANEYNEQKFKDNNYDKYLFCGKCGAKMDKE